ncbi:LOW QUALITY PROTEIN: FK506-binding protein 15 [Bombina bombina]|uniref:LOW QUALITY PROTEIN: FK506-binding protein 15 n=1 Tax=Bombina bombina TaxID=8345 RepID=UPI00235B2C15|nr:LOW QUALITY PROTEIN: FK506-binding protein 15 [Bombina bombina]
MFGGDEDDADFLSPTGGAKLASLFGLDQAVSGGGNETFQYTAPKQPKKSHGTSGTKASKPSGPGNSAAAPSVLFATAVHAHKYVNGQFVKQGKFGAAVLGNHTTKEYRILIYLSQQQPVTTARIHPGFVFTVQLNSYAAFYDDHRQSWSMMFESEAAAIDFSKQICICKYNSSPSLESVLCQDLVLGDGQAAELGDFLEVAYTGWLFQNHGLGQVFDSNVQKEKFLRLKLGSGKVIKGWEEGMLGIQKGGSRFLIIPPNLGYGSQGISGRIPPNATLVFEVEVKRMKLKDQGSDKQSIGSRDSPVSITDSLPTEVLPQPPSSVPPKPGEPAVRAKSNSISEQLANPDVAKAKLISRMAKMGQPMLPFLAGSTTPQPDSSDSEMEDPNTHRVLPQPAVPVPIQPTPQMSHTPATHIHAPVPQPAVPGLPISSAALLPAGHIHSQVHPSGTTPAFQPYSGIQYTYSQPSAATTQLQTVGPLYPSPLQPTAPYQASGDVTTFMMTEARQHSTEIRMAINKVVDKIDNLSSKVDVLQKENTIGNSHLLPGISSITMESAMIMNNIQRIIQENERLKHEVLEKSSRIEEQNVKIGDLVNRNQRYVEQSNLLMEQRNDSLKTTSENSQARMLHVVQEKAKVTEELAEATGQVSRLQLEVTEFQKKEMELRTQLAAALQEADKHRSQLSSLQVQLIEVQENSEQTKTRAKTEKESRRQLETRLAALEEELADLKAEKGNLEKGLAERKRKSQQERQRAEEEQEEIRRSFQEEMENLRQLLKKTQKQVASEQLSAKTNDAQRMAELQDQADQLQPLRDKYAKLHSQMVALMEERKKLLSKEEDQTSGKDTTEEVKKIMNGVFQKLRGDFDLEEMYSGRDVLGTIMKTIKATTLQLLNKQQVEEPVESSSEDEEEDEEEDVTQNQKPTIPKVEVEEKKPTRESSSALNGEPQRSPAHQKEEAPPNINEESPKICPENEATSLDVAEEKHLETQSTPNSVEEGDGLLQVEVIQENFDAPSALVHMISSDMLDTSTISDTEEKAEYNKENVAPLGDHCSFSELRTSNNVEVLEHNKCQATITNISDKAIGDGTAVPKESASKPEFEDLEEEKAGVPPPLGSDEDSSSPVPPKEKKGKKPSKPEESKQKGSISLGDSDEDDLFKTASPKLLKPKHEDEEEEEVSMKGCPPPAPLFGDDDDEDDDDLDWLSGR